MANPETIKEFLVRVGFKVDQESFNKFNQGLKTATKNVAKFGAVSLAAGAAVFKFTESVAKDFERIGLMSERIGVSAEEIQKLGFEASLTGSSVNAAESALQSINKAAGDARLGIGSARIWFERLRVAVVDSNNHVRDSADILRDLGNSIKTLDRPTQISALQQLGVDQTLIRTLTSDVSDLSAEFDKVYKDAGINADEAARKSIKFMDSMTRLKFSMSAVGKAVGIEFGGRITDAMDDFRKWIENNIPKIINNLRPIIDTTLDILKGVRILSVAFIEGFSAINDLTGGLLVKISALGSAWKLLNLEFLATPIGFAIGVITSLTSAIGLLIDDFKTFEEGGKSFFDWTEYAPAIEAVAKALRDVHDALSAISGSNAYKTFIDSLKGTFTGGLAGKGVISSGKNFLQDPFGSSQAALAGVPSSAASISNVSNNAPVLNQETNIVVNGAQNAQATATDIQNRQSRVNQDLVRNMRGPVR